MRLRFWVGMLLMGFAGAIPASQAEEVLAAQRLQVRLKGSEFRALPHRNHQVIELPECDRGVAPAGAPDLPVRYVKLLIPAGATATRATLVSGEERKLPGRFKVYPAQPPVRPGDPPPAFVEGRKDIYESREPYPAQRVELLGTGRMAGYSVAHIAVHPLRYIGARGELRLTTDFEIEVEYALNSEDSPLIHPNRLEHFRETVRRLADNSEDEPKFRPHVRGRPDLNRESAEARRKILENPRARRRASEKVRGSAGAAPAAPTGDDGAALPTAGETISLSSAAYTVNENAGSVTITVQCTPRAAANLSVGYATANGTAVSPADFTGGSGTVTISKNQTSKTFTIPIINDSAYEGDETFTVSITSVPSGTTLGTPSTATITITDDDVPPGGFVALSASSYTVDENGRRVTVSAVRYGDKNGAASVQYATSDGTALAGAHYIAVSGTLQWNDQEDGPKYFTIPILDNSGFAAPDKTFTVALSNAAGATLVAPTSAAVTIVENDPDPNRTEYLIITSAALAPAFQTLADHRAAFNKLTTRVLTTESIYAAYPGNKPNGGTDNQTRIRNCILDYVNNHGTLYVVLGGDDTVVPDRDTYVKVDSYVSSNCPADFYYAGLNGNWDDWDADGVYGEADVGGIAAQDEGDLYADVIVGRIPVRTAEHVNAYVNKLIAYETNPPPALLRKMMLSGLKLWDSYTGDGRPSDLQDDGHREFRDAAHPTVSDSEMWTRRKYRDKVKNFGWTASTLGMMFDTITSWDGATAGDYAGGGANLVARYSEGWNFVVNDTHGNTTVLTAESGDFNTSQAASLTGLTAHFRTGACLSAGFDQGEPSLSEAMLRNPNGGALVYIGGARYGWGSPDAPPASNYGWGGATSDYILDWLTEIFKNKNVFAGSAYYTAKALKISLSDWYYVYRWIYFSENLQGDPLVPIYGVKPFVRISASPSTIEENGGPDAVFTITRVDDLSNSATIYYTRSGSAVYGVDYTTSPATSASGSITIPAGAASATITVTPLNDAAADPSETVVFSISPNAAYQIFAGGADASVAIHDDDTLSVVTDAPVVGVPEGGTAVFRVRLDNPIASNVVVSVARATGDADLSVASGASLTFTPSNWSEWQTVTLSAAEDADAVNGAATFELTAPGAVSAYVMVEEADDDFALTLEVSPAGAGSTTPAGTVVVDPADLPYAISAQPGPNYQFSNWTVVSGSATFADPNSASTTVTLTAHTTIRAGFAGNPNLVTSMSDTGDDATIGASLLADIQDGGGLSLREAVNWAAAGSTIAFYGDQPTVTLAGPITIAKNLTLDGAGKTVIDGNNAGRLFYVYNGSAVLDVTLRGLTLQNGRAVATDADALGGAIYSNGERLVLRDCVIRNCTVVGDASASATRYGYGGAIATNADLTLENCRFENNTATGTDEGGYQGIGRGGAIRQNGGTLTIANCVFEGNTATAQSSTSSQGGAIHKDGGGAVNITGGRFAGNSAANNGGAVNIGNYATTIDGTVFENNSGGSGGALYSTGPLTLQNATFSANTASGSGGGIWASNTIELSNSTFRGQTAISNGGAVYFEGNATIRDCVFGGPNEADRNQAAVGGAIYSNASYDQRESALMERCEIRNNRATGANGGGLYNNAGAFTIRDCVFDGNSVAGTTGGGAIRNNSSTMAMLEIVGCLFANNTATGSGADGGAIHNAGRLTLVNSTLHGNTAADQGGALYHDNSTTGLLQMAHCTVMDNVSNGSGTGTNAAAAVRFNSRLYAAIHSSIVYGNTGNTSSKDISGGFDALRNSIVGQLVTAPTVSENNSTSNPSLGALQDNGGPTLTRLPQTGSPAIDNALSISPLRAPISDRYGFFREVSGIIGLAPGVNTDADGRLHVFVGPVQSGEAPVVRFFKDAARTELVGVSQSYTPGGGVVTLAVTPAGGSGLGGNFTFNASAAFATTDYNDGSNQIVNTSYANLTGLAFSNTDEGRLYVTIAVANGTATANFYKDSARTQLVASSASWTAATVGDMTVTAANSSGIGGFITTAGTPTADSDIYAIVLPADRFLALRAYTTDARGTGYPRIVGAAADIGAVETPVANYAVVYNGNGHTGGEAPTDPNSPYTAGATVTVLNAGSLAKTGHTFTGWNTAADGTGTSYAPGETFSMPEVNVTLYAQWVANSYTVAFDSNGGAAPEPASKPATFGQPYGALAATSRNGYLFQGWFTAAEGGAQVTEATVVSTAEDHTLYAHWEPTPYQSWSDSVAWNPGDDTAPTGDPDGDGLANLIEYAFNLSPVESNAGVAVTTVSTRTVEVEGQTRTRATLTFTPRNTNGLRFIVESTSDLTAEWTQTDVTDQVQANVPFTFTDTVDLTGSGAKRFLRLRVVETP